MAQLVLAARLARREMRAGFRGLRVFILCLTLGVAAIAAVGMMRAAINAGLTQQATALLGGDAQIELSYRFASPEERQALARIATQVSEIVDFRSMAVVGEERALVQVKAVDAAYPLVGQVELQPAIGLDQALAHRNGLPGAVMAPDLAARLGLVAGDSFALGGLQFRLGALLLSEPDSSAGQLTLAPRMLLRSADLAGSGLLQPGSLFETGYRMLLPEGTNLSEARRRLLAELPESGASWSDKRRPAPGIARFVGQLAAFLVLVGIAGLAVGGVGISAALRAWLGRRTETIATLKVLGASTALIFHIYLLQAGVITLIGVVAGLVLGAGVPLVFAGAIEAALPFPAAIAPYPRPILEAGFYGVMTALVFALWPLAQAAGLRAAVIYRGMLAERARVASRVASRVGSRFARQFGSRFASRALVALALAIILLLGAAVRLSGQPRLALWTLAGILAALVTLLLVAQGICHLARWLAGRRALQGRVVWRLALAAIGAQPAETRAVILSLGLGLTVLAAVGQIDANLRTAISRELPARAPSFFFIDIQSDQLAPLKALMAENPAVHSLAEAPMLRGIVTRINNRPGREVAGNHWVFNGDRGVTSSAQPPEGTRITEGQWWPPDYTGPAQISFSATEAGELGLKLGDRMTVNILGRDLEGEITSFREVDFTSGGIGFIMSMNPSALAGAPYSYIATVHADAAAEPAILRAVGRAWPNITAISIKETVARVSQALGQIATATSLAALVVLLMGFVVLIGAAAAAEPARLHEAAVLRVLGATRRAILVSFALRQALMGAAAGIVAVVAGAAGSWAVMRFVMEARWHFAPMLALAIVLGGIVTVVLAGAAFARRPLRLPPARVLRARD